LEGAREFQLEGAFDAARPHRIQHYVRGRCCSVAGRTAGCGGGGAGVTLGLSGGPMMRTPGTTVLWPTPPFRISRNSSSGIALESKYTQGTFDAGIVSTGPAPPRAQPLRHRHRDPALVVAAASGGSRGVLAIPGPCRVVGVERGVRRGVLRPRIGDRKSGAKARLVSAPGMTVSGCPLGSKPNRRATRSRRARFRAAAVSSTESQGCAWLAPDSLGSHGPLEQTWKLSGR